MAGEYSNIPDDRSLTKSSVTLNGSSQSLLAADPARLVVTVSNAATNGSAAVDPTGGTCALDAGIPLEPGQTVILSGQAAKSAWTCFGTSGQKLTVYVG
jgi:hypothetical protein